MKSKKNLDFIKTLPCMVSDKKCVGPIDAHHWRTRGAGGLDELLNLAPLCRRHHTEVHQIGRKTFFKKYEEKIVLMRRAFQLPPLGEGS